MLITSKKRESPFTVYQMNGFLLSSFIPGHWNIYYLWNGKCEQRRRHYLNGHETNLQGKRCVTPQMKTFDCLIMRGDQRTNRMSAWSKPCVTSYFILALLSFLSISLSIQLSVCTQFFLPLREVWDWAWNIPYWWRNTRNPCPFWLVVTCAQESNN